MQSVIESVAIKVIKSLFLKVLSSIFFFLKKEEKKKCWDATNFQDNHSEKLPWTGLSHKPEEK